MNALTITNHFQTNSTMLPNSFIDHYMASANGEFVKVYLFLLRHMDDSRSSLTISMIADCLNNTENDVLRAFRYWESVGLLSLVYDETGAITGLEFTAAAQADPVSENATGSSAAQVTNNTTSTARAAFISHSPSISTEGAGFISREAVAADASKPGKSTVSADTAVAGSSSVQQEARKDDMKAQKELKSLFFIAEQYLGKTLTHTDVDTITYFYDTLHMSADLIEYLIESCVENNHKSMHYIQKVAISWTENGVRTISQAKEQSAAYSRNCYTVLNAFGIKNRGPAVSELAFINKWGDEYGFSADIIQEACRRTITATHQPSFEYADKILSKWYQNNVHHLKDIVTLDETYQKEKPAYRFPSRQKNLTKNLNNFERRNYDMDSLEEKLLNSN